jgi:O-antigen biosynthesis protein
VIALRSLASRHNRIAGFGQRMLHLFPPLQDAIIGLMRGDARRRYELWVAAYDTVVEADLSAMRKELSRWPEPQLLSLVVPITDTSDAMLEVFVNSLCAQVYEQWEVNFISTSPNDEHVIAFLAQLSSRDSRFRQLPQRQPSLAETWNAALRSSASEFAVLVSPWVSLRPHALFLIARAIESDPDAVLVYGDEDAIDESGSRYDHYFKPDWNEALLRSQNYLGDLVCFRRSRALAVGGCQEEPDGDCAWGLFLRLTADASPTAIRHLPFVLSHRRTAARASSGKQRQEEVARALERRLAGVGERAQVEPAGEASYRTRYALPDEPPTVTIIVPTTCKLDFLRPCLNGILNRTSYPKLEVLVVVNGMRVNTTEQWEYLEEIGAVPYVRLLFNDDCPYNFSKTNNWAADQAKGELLCFLNDDTEVIATDWLSTMTGHVLRDRVAAVGAMLLYPNGRIQHAGVVLGAGGVAAHTYRSMPGGIHGYHDRAVIDQDVSCVTAACMLVRRDAFSNVGGFDETLAVAFNDVDLCLRMHEAGWRIVWTPSARLHHKESASIGRHETAEGEGRWMLEWNRIRSRWGAQLMSDPQYSPNLSLDALQLWEPAFPPRVSYPWRPRGNERGESAEIMASYAAR